LSSNNYSLFITPYGVIAFVEEALEQQQLFIIYHALRRDSFCGGSA